MAVTVNYVAPIDPSAENDTFQVKDCNVQPLVVRWSLVLLGLSALMMLGGAVPFSARSNHSKKSNTANDDSILFDRKYLFKNDRPKDSDPQTELDVNDFIFDVSPGPRMLSTTFEGDTIEIYGTKNENGTADRITHFYVGKDDNFVRTELDENGRISSVSNTENGFSLEIDWKSDTKAQIIVGINNTQYTVAIDTEAPASKNQFSSQETPPIRPRTADLTLQMHSESGHVFRNPSDENEDNTLEFQVLEDSIVKTAAAFSTFRRVVVQIKQCDTPYNNAQVRLCYELKDSSGSLTEDDCMFATAEPGSDGIYSFWINVDVEAESSIPQNACETVFTSVDLTCGLLEKGPLKTTASRVAFCGAIAGAIEVISLWIPGDSVVIFPSCTTVLERSAKLCQMADKVPIPDNSPIFEEFCDLLKPREAFTAVRWDLQARLVLPIQYFTTIADTKGATIPGSFSEDFVLPTHDIDPTGSASIEKVEIDPSSPVSGQAYTVATTVRCVASDKGEFVSMNILGTDTYTDEVYCYPPTGDITQCFLRVPGAYKGVYDRITVALEPNGDQRLFGVLFG